MPAPNTTVAPDEEVNVLGTGLEIYADDIEGGSDSDVSEEFIIRTSAADTFTGRV